MARGSDDLTAGPNAPRAGRDPMSRTQWAWAVAGLVIVATICAIATENLQNIYQEEKDFVIGGAFSLAGACFARAFTRPRNQRAMEVLRSQGAAEHMAPAERNIEAAAERLAEYHDLQCREPEFDRNLGLLRVTLDDLDQSQSDLQALRRSLGLDPGPAHSLPTEYAHARLLQVRRNIRAALGRRREFQDWLDQQPPGDSGQSWDKNLFTVLTQDLHHASRSIDIGPLCRPSCLRIPGHRPRQSPRGQGPGGAVRTRGSGRGAGPELFRVLRGDIDEAIRDLWQVARMLPHDPSADDTEGTAPQPGPAPSSDRSSSPTPHPA